MTTTDPLSSPSFLSPSFLCPSFLCPYCYSPLTPYTKTWLCDGSGNTNSIQHPFDVARQGYVNLLPVQHKKSKQPGDSQDSIDARHRFLRQGFYQPLQQLIATLIANTLNCTANNMAQTWLDIGCGEGYYTSAIAQALSTSNVLFVNNLIALDISKPAVTQLAQSFKSHRTLWYQIEATRQSMQKMQAQAVMLDFVRSMPAAATYPMVASASHLPLAESSIHGIISIFSPILPKEFARVLKADGSLIIAKPDAGHLQGIREALFDEVRPHDSDKFLEELASDFKLVTTHEVTADLCLDRLALADLLTMTPYSYRAKSEKRKALLAQVNMQQLVTQARFVVYELVKV